MKFDRWACFNLLLPIIAVMRKRSEEMIYFNDLLNKVNNAQIRLNNGLLGEHDFDKNLRELEGFLNFYRKRGGK